MPFIRSREFLWQEGHTAHLTKEEAGAEVLQVRSKSKALVIRINLINPRSWTGMRVFTKASFSGTGSISETFANDCPRTYRPSSGPSRERNKN